MVESAIEKESENSHSDSADQERLVFTANNNKKSQQVLLQKKNKERSLSVKDLRSHDKRIISLLYQEKDLNYQYSFKGLLRKLKIHQQSLSRALCRLQDLGLIKKSDIGYNLSGDGKSLCLFTNGAKKIFEKERKNEFSSLIHIYIPVGVDARKIVRILTGRWFNKLRWSGFAETANEKILNWSNGDNPFQIRLRITSNLIIIETNAGSVRDKIDSMVNACRILEHVTKIFNDELDNSNTYYELADHNNSYLL